MSLKDYPLWHAFLLLIDPSSHFYKGIESEAPLVCNLLVLFMDLFFSMIFLRRGGFHEDL